MITDPLNDKVIEQRIQDYAAQSDELEGDSKKVVVGLRKFVRPLTEAANNLIETIRNPGGRIMFGIKEIDVLMRGIGKGELCYISGYTQGGKTQIFLNAVKNNHEKHIVLFTMDEPAEMVLAKLVALEKHWSFEWVEEQVKDGNQAVLSAIRSVASERYKNLIVVDQKVSTSDMSAALREAEDYFGIKRVDLVGVDYLRLLEIPAGESDGQTIVKKSVAIKQWTQTERVPMLCIHQGSRGKTSRGQQAGLDSMEYGGEQEAHFILTVRRLMNDESLSEAERETHQNTVNVALVKSKRLPPRLGEYTFYIDPDYGLVRSLHSNDIPRRNDLFPYD